VAAARRRSSRSTGCRNLRTLSVDADRIEIGAALTLTEIERRLDGQVPLLAQLIPQFASRLIRNAATLGGNLGTGSPIGDSPPVLLALEAGVVLADADGEREVALAGLLHRLPAERATAGRADPRGAYPAAARAAGRVPQDRQAALRRHLQRGRGVRLDVRGVCRGKGTHRPRRGGRDADPGPGHR